MIKITLPIRTVSEANSRECWQAKARRSQEQRQAAYLITTSEMHGIDVDEITRPIVIKFVRVGKRNLDGDNLSRSFKAIRDGVCEAIGIDDGAECLRFVYAQKRGDYGVEVFIC